MPDDKFLDYYIEMSEKFIPDESSYICYSNNDNYKYIKNKTNVKIKKINNHQESFEKLLKHLDNVNVIIFHSFTTNAKSFIDKLPKDIKKIWIFWGFEGYATLPKSKLLTYDTYKAQYPKTFLGFFKSNYSFAKNYLISSKPENKKIIQKIDYCATWIEDDYKLIAKKINTNIKSMYFNYYTNELMNLAEITINHNTNNLLLGNSASPTNNHIDALKYLKKINFSDKIYCPLSYGGSNTYIENVINFGNNNFGSNFIPILDFLELKEYQNMINSCKFIWMNHIRQQAAGNIFAAFSAEKVVILNSKSFMKSTFNKWGIKYFDKTVLITTEYIKFDELKNNRLIINKKLGLEANRNFFNKLLQL